VLASCRFALAALFSQTDDSYDRRIVRRSARRECKPVETDVPGLLLLEIDGLAEPVLSAALADGTMPRLASWLERGSHRLTRWEPTSLADGASQAGILLATTRAWLPSLVES